MSISAHRCGLDSFGQFYALEQQAIDGDSIEPRMADDCGFLDMGLAASPRCRTENNEKRRRKSK